MWRHRARHNEMERCALMALMQASDNFGGHDAAVTVAPDYYWTIKQPHQLRHDLIDQRVDTFCHWLRGAVLPSRRLHGQDVIAGRWFEQELGKERRAGA